MDLPIDTVPNSRPPRFKWRQYVNTPVGPRAVDHEGSLPPSVEDAVASLVRLAKQQAREILSLRQTNEELALAVSENMAVRTPPQPPPVQASTSRRSRG